MNDTIITIEGENVDLEPGTVVTQSLKAFSIGELGTRHVNFTNQFKVPRTRNNDRIFENAGNVSSETLVPYRAKPCKIEQDGIETVIDGVLSLEETGQEYNIQILSGAKGFFDTIEGRMLSDLTGFAFPGDVAYMADRRDATDNVIYPVGYYGTEAVNVPVYQDLSFLFVHSAFEKIFEDAGYEVDWTPPDGKFAKMVFSAYGSGGAKYAKSFIERLRAEVYVESSQTFSPSTGTPINFTGIRSIGDENIAYWDGLNAYLGNDQTLPTAARLFLARVKYSISITVTGGTVDIGSGFTGLVSFDFTNVGSGTYSFESVSELIVINDYGLSLLIRNSGSPLFTDSDFSNWTNEGPDAALSPWDIDTETFWAYPNAIPGQPANSCFFRSGSFTVVPSGTSLTGNIRIQAVNGTTGDMNIYMWDGSGRELIDTIAIVGNGFYQFLSWSGSTTQNNTNIEIQYVITSGDTTVFVDSISFGGAAVSVTVNAGSLIIEPSGDYFNRVSASTPSDINYYAALLPDIKQSDVIKEIAVHYGLQFEEKFGVVYLKRLDDIISDRSNAKDWTLKRVKSTEPIKYAYQDYAKRNYFRYIVGNDMSELYGQGFFDIDNQNLEQQKTIYTSFFENTGTRFEGGFVFADIPVYDEANPADIVRKFDNNVGPKILLIRDKYSYEPSVTYLDGNPYSDYKVIYFDDPNQSDTMKFHQDIDRNYSLLVSCLQRAKIVNREYKLTPLDIADFSFFFPIFDSGEYFLVNEIKNFINRVPNTSVEIFKV